METKMARILIKLFIIFVIVTSVVLGFIIIPHSIKEILETIK
jgi:uncharacterized SAM-binding protein YcdF (DUF218 family)